MDAEFWQQRWQADQTGFHLQQVNPCLVRHFSALRLAPGQQVFVPLCGKSLDLIWLVEQGYRVFGIELSPLAIEAFFQQYPYTPLTYERDGLRFHIAGPITLVEGDFFVLSRLPLVNVAAVYDRAAYIALPPKMRQQYVQKLTEMCPDQPRLLVTLEYTQAEMAGPPFSVQEPEVVGDYAQGFEVQCLAREDVLAGHARFAEKGLTGLHEAAYILQRDHGKIVIEKTE